MSKPPIYTHPRLPETKIEEINSYIQSYSLLDTEKVKQIYEKNKCPHEGRGLSKSLYTLLDPNKKNQCIAAREILKSRGQLEKEVL